MLGEDPRENPLREHSQINERWRTECNLHKWLLCEAHNYQNLRGPSSSLEVLVRHLPFVFEIRPQGEGKGIQAYILVPITHLKPRVLDLIWRDETDHSSRRGGIRLTHINIHNFM